MLLRLTIAPGPSGLTAARHFVHRLPDLSQMIAGSLREITLNRHGTEWLLTIRRARLSVQGRQQLDRLAQQNGGCSYMIRPQPGSVDLPIRLALLSADVPGHHPRGGSSHGTAEAQFRVSQTQAGEVYMLGPYRGRTRTDV
jgi:hypothetical protein